MTDRRDDDEDDEYDEYDEVNVGRAAEFYVDGKPVTNIHDLLAALKAKTEESDS